MMMICRQMIWLLFKSRHCVGHHAALSSLTMSMMTTYLSIRHGSLIELPDQRYLIPMPYSNAYHSYLALFSIPFLYFSIHKNSTGPLLCKGGLSLAVDVFQL